MSADESFAPDLLEIEASGAADLDTADCRAAVGVHIAGARIPLILVHTWAGEAGHLQQLGRRLGAEQPLLALSPPRGEWPHDYPRTVESWAEFCWPTLRRLRPRGPYLLGGWSFGGVVALALAERLAADGEDVRRVVLLDTLLPKKHPRPRSRRGLLRQSLHHLDETLGMPPGQRLAYARARLRRLGRRATRKLAAVTGPLRSAAPPQLPEPEMSPLKRAIWTAYLRFEPFPSALPVSLFWTRESYERLGDLTLGWGAHLHGAFESRAMPGKHITFLDPPHVDVLAPALRLTLEAAQG